MAIVAKPKFDQSGKPAGVALESRDDLDSGVAVTVTDTGPGPTRLWELVDKPDGSAAVLTASSGVSTQFTPDISGSYAVRLTVNGGPSSDYITTRVAGVQLALPQWITLYGRDLRIPAAGETDWFNVRSSPDSGANTRGWALEVNKFFNTVASYAFGVLGLNSSSPLTDVNGDAEFRTLNFGSGLTASADPVLAGQLNVEGGAPETILTYYNTGGGAPNNIDEFTDWNLLWAAFQAAKGYVYVRGDDTYGTPDIPSGTWDCEYRLILGTKFELWGDISCSGTLVNIAGAQNTKIATSSGYIMFVPTAELRNVEVNTRVRLDSANTFSNWVFDGVKVVTGSIEPTTASGDEFVLTLRGGSEVAADAVYGSTNFKVRVEDTSTISEDQSNHSGLLFFDFERDRDVVNRGWVEADQSKFTDTAASTSTVTISGDLWDKIPPGSPVRFMMDEPYVIKNTTGGLATFDNITGMDPKVTRGRVAFHDIKAVDLGGGNWKFQVLDGADATNSRVVGETASFSAIGNQYITDSPAGLGGYINVSSMPTVDGGVWTLDWYQYAVADAVTTTLLTVSGEALPTRANALKRIWIGDSEHLVHVNMFANGDWYSAGTNTDLQLNYSNSVLYWRHPDAVLCRFSAYSKTMTASAGNEPFVGPSWSSGGPAVTGRMIEVLAAATLYESQPDYINRVDGWYITEGEALKAQCTQQGTPTTAEYLTMETVWVLP
jgi:hypothetical protein